MRLSASLAAVFTLAGGAAMACPAYEDCHRRDHHAHHEGWGGRYEAHSGQHERRGYARASGWERYEHGWEKARPAPCLEACGEITLPASFFLDAGGVGPIPDAGFWGGGGGFAFADAGAFAGARASSFAHASAHASAHVNVGVNVRFRGGFKGHKPHPPKGGKKGY